MEKHQELIKHISLLFRKEGITYLDSKYIIQQVRKRNGIKGEKSSTGIKEHLSQEDIRCILNTAYDEPGVHGLLIKVLLFGGFRVNEFVNIKRIDVSLAENKILVREGKGDKMRYVPIFSFFKDELSLYMTTTTGIYLFESRLHDKYTTRRIQQVLREISLKAGINKRVHPHMLRRTIATWLRDKGVPIEQIKDFLGHERIDTTLIYAKGSIQQMQSIMNKALIEHDNR